MNRNHFGGVLRVALAFFSVVVVLLISFVFLDGTRASFVVRNFGFWVVLALIVMMFCLFSFEHLVVLVRDKGFRDTHVAGLIAVIAMTSLIHWGNRDRYDVLFDEYVIGVTALNTHLSGKCHVGVLAETESGRFAHEDLSVDKRPVMYAVLLSLVHSAIGYDPENVFLLNCFLTFVLLSLVYGICTDASGRSVGIFCVLVMGSIPLLGFSANAGGYELLNLCGILALLWVSYSYVKSENGTAMNRMVMCSVFLAYCRYESIAYVLVPVFLVVSRWIRNRSLSITWTTSFSPLWLILPLASNRVFFADENFFQTDMADFWSLKHFFANLKPAYDFLFDFSGSYGGSGFWTFLIIGSFVVYAYRLLFRKGCDARQRLWTESWITVFMVSLINTIAAISIFWGAWTDPMTARFSLPIHLTLTIGLSLFVPFVDWRKERRVLWVGVLFVILIGMHGMSRSASERRMLVSACYSWGIDEAEKALDRRETMIMSEGRLGFVLYGYPSEGGVRASFQPKRFAAIVESGLLEDGVVVAETFLLDGSDRDLFGGYRLFRDSDFIIDWISRKKVRDDLEMRYGKLVGVRSPVASGGYWNRVGVGPDIPHVGGRIQ